jgi:hypothetical protein
LKVNDAFCPFSKRPVLSGVPAPETWCGESSVFVHVTVFPGITVMPGGPKVKAPMFTPIDPAGAGAALATMVRPASAG